MTPAVIRRWIDIIENGRTDELEDMLAEDAVFYSPAVFTPQVGRAKAAAYLSAAERMFAGADFRYVEQWFSQYSAILEFTTDLDGIHIDGIDMIHWNDDDRIVSFKVMIRPLKALQSVIPRMGSLLQQGF